MIPLFLTVFIVTGTFIEHFNLCTHLVCDTHNNQHDTIFNVSVHCYGNATFIEHFILISTDLVCDPHSHEQDSSLSGSVCSRDSHWSVLLSGLSIRDHYGDVLHGFSVSVFGSKHHFPCL